MIYLIGGMALVIALLGGYADIQKHRVAEAQAQVQALGAKIEQQNQAIAQTKADGDRRVAEAQKGVQASQERTKAALNEAARLRTAASGKTPLGACPAGMAVAELRKGFR